MSVYYLGNLESYESLIGVLSQTPTAFGGTQSTTGDRKKAETKSYQRDLGCE